MKSHAFRYIAILCTLLLVSNRASALTNESPKPPVAEALPPGAQVAAIEIQPAKVVLTGKYESAQLVVTAKLASGDSTDVTRIAKLLVEGEIAEVSATGQVKPLKNGAGSLRVELAGQTAAVPVEVVEMKDARPVDFIRDVNPVMTKLGCN